MPPARPTRRALGIAAGSLRRHRHSRFPLSPKSSSHHSSFSSLIFDESLEDGHGKGKINFSSSSSSRSSSSSSLRQDSGLDGDSAASSADAAAFVPSLSSSSSSARIRILAINDVYELENLPRLATLRRQLDPPPDAVVLAGDFLSPSMLSSIDQGKGMVDMLNRVSQ